MRWWLSDGYTPSTSHHILLLHLLILLEQLLLIIQILLVVDVKWLLSVLAGGQGDLVVELGKLTVLVDHGAVGYAVWSQLRQILPIILAYICHVTCSTLIHRALIELWRAALITSIQIYPFEFPVICICHDFILRVRRFGQELLLGAAGRIFHSFLHNGLVAHVAVDGRGREWVGLLLFEESWVGTLNTAHIRLLIKLVWIEAIGLADNIHMLLLLSTLPYRAIAPRSDAKTRLIRSEIHLLLGSLQKRAGCSRIVS